MATTNRKNRDSIKFNSKGLWIKAGITEFENFGEEISVKQSPTDSTDSITLMTGYVVNKLGSREHKLSLVLAQSDKAIKDRIEELLGTSVKLILDNGVVGSKKQAYYYPEVTFIGVGEIEFAGKKHQALNVELSAMPQNSAISVTPSTDFPTEMGFVLATPVVGKNPFYVIVEE